MEFLTDYKLEEYILNLKWDDLTDEVRERTIMCSIDLFGALILGSYGSQYKIGQNLAKSLGLNGNIPIIGNHDSKYNILGATMILSHASNSFDIDDGNKQICGHPGASFIGGVLAAALHKRITYKEFLATLVVCYETTIRWAMAMQNHYKFLHSSGSYGAFGTAVGIGKILELSREKLNVALSIADYHAPMVPVMRAVEYPSMNKDGVPFGSFIGCMAIEETLNGYTGKTHLLELPEYAYLLDNLNKKYYINDLYYKPYTCCRWTHQPIKACLTLKQRYKFDHTQINSVIVYTFDAAARLSKVKPKDTDEAQYNIAFPIACALVFNNVGFNEICDENVKNPDILQIMDKLSFSVDPNLDALFPDKRLAYVEITLNNGKVLKSEICEADGEPDDPNINLNWIIKKFKRITAPIISSEKQDIILRYLTDIDNKDFYSIFNQISKSIDLRNCPKNKSLKTNSLSVPD